MSRVRMALGGAAVLGGFAYCMDARSAVHQYIVCPTVRALTPDGEDAHTFGIWVFKHGLYPRVPLYALNKNNDVLASLIFGMKLNLPIGLAAGFDKDGECIDTLLDLGFSVAEIGSVTPEPQPGNPRPRMFRLPNDWSIINRYGFNSQGHFAMLARLKQRFEKQASKGGNESNAFRPGSLLAVNIGKNKNGDEVNDYVLGVRRFALYSDMLVVNVSLPNTPGLRDLQSEDRLQKLLGAVVAERNTQGPNKLGRTPPILVKIAPDLTEPEVQSIASAAQAAKIDGIIVSNTTIERPPTLISDKNRIKETGGLSGPPLKPYALRTLRTLRKYTKDSGLVLVGSGGISNAEDVLEFGRAGASYVQVLTSFAYKGPGFPANLRNDVAEALRREGKTWTEIVGLDP